MIDSSSEWSDDEVEDTVSNLMINAKGTELSNDKDKDTRCIICMNNRIDVNLSPCNHKIMCVDCLNELIRRLDWRCPICRTEITKTSLTY